MSGNFFSQYGVYIVLTIIFLIVVFYISTYNKLTRAKNSVLESKSGIDIALLKRFDLITDLVETVKGYTKHEKELLEDLTKIRSQVQTSPSAANESMNTLVDKLNVTIESYPDLKASEQFLNLQKNMSNVEEHLQASRRLFNNNVTSFNNMTEQFPSSIIAKMHKFTKFTLFETDPSNLVKPTVEF